jgi:hypothetical protein
MADGFTRARTGTLGGARRGTEGRETLMIGVLIAILVAALVYALCLALGLPSIVGIVAAILVLLAGIPSGGFGFGGRFSHGRRY